MQLRDFEQAAERLKSVVHHTEMDRVTTFSDMTGGQIYLKCENRQKTGSFKIRGASNKIAAMMERGEKVPVVASSAGNHAQGVAYAATKLGLPATIVMPKTAPIAKVQATEGYGAKVVLHGDLYDDAYAKACQICEEEGATFLHPYNDLEVIAGQGTLGLEILQDLPYVDVVIVPAGGGGLLAGVASAIKLINPRIKVYGVQAEGANAIARSFAEKKLVCTETAATIADGIAVKSPGDITVELINRYADGVLTVSDTEIADAILLLMERCKQIVEPAGATPLAAVLSGKLDVKDQRVVCVMSGGNIDVSFVQSIIERGLVARYRRIKFTATLLDKPGSLVQLLNVIADAGANILTVEHDKLNLRLNPNETNVHIACEVGGKDHGVNLIAKLRRMGYRIDLD
ncbi:MAG: threonine ammonia-lyase [Clostridiales bacterium]|nr:threonine ammonia-lyase [Clostridiales bacterium]MBQ3107888.1 threonine ammonia-lyase [Bacillota bacterium]